MRVGAWLARGFWEITIPGVLLTGLQVWSDILDHFKRPIFAGTKRYLVLNPTWQTIQRWKALCLNFLFHISSLSNALCHKELWPFSQRETVRHLHLSTKFHARCVVTSYARQLYPQYGWRGKSPIPPSKMNALKNLSWFFRHKNLNFKLVLTALEVWSYIYDHFERLIFAGLFRYHRLIPTWQSIRRWKDLHLNFLFHPSGLNNVPGRKKLWSFFRGESPEDLHLISV